jgi:hypothetical protein
MTKNIRFAFSVGDTKRAGHNQCRARQVELVIPNTMISVIKCWGLSPTLYAKDGINEIESK